MQNVYLRVEEYIHLRDAINSDGNVNLNDLGTLTILPSSYTGSPRHMHEYAQDAMTYVRHYGRPDPFITFTCNQQWSEVKEHLLSGQLPTDRRDITARVFKQKLKALMDFIVKHKVFGEIRCHPHDIEVDNRWIVPYSPLLLKTFKAQINVEYCNSVKSIKYICKYINKGSDTAIFGVVHSNRNDEITQFQLGVYISSNEAVWRIFTFPIHERHPTVVHLSVHFENGHRAYFTSETALQRAIIPPFTKLHSYRKSGILYC